jgi:antitoxin component of MazEF toxin-antitoxin module
MRKRLTKTGNSLAMVLDRSLLEEAGIDANTEIEVTTVGGAIVMTPITGASKRRALFKEALRIANDQYGALFARLAK